MEGTGRELTSCKVRESSRRAPRERELRESSWRAPRELERAHGGHRGERAHGGHRPGERAREENGKLLKFTSLYSHKMP
jgi:hypothetical protein